MAYRWKKRKWIGFRKRLSSKDNTRNIVIVVGILAVLVLVYIFLQNILSPAFVELGIDYFSLVPELSTADYVQAEIDAGVENGMGVVTLTGECYQIVAYTEEVQARSIANGLAGYIGLRPGTHDLIKDALEQLGVNVVMVKVTELRNSTFFGRLVIRQGNRIVSLDARPSDATAIAVRVGAPVYVKEDLMKEYGQRVC